MKIYIGHDDREQAAYDVCRNSILRRASIPVEIVPLMHRQLRNKGLFNRRWSVEANGQYICQEDGRPFSTQFSHSRFLVPELARIAGDDWALFIDCDFMFLDDVAKLYDLRNPSFALQVVKHDYQSDGIKMDGMIQNSYTRKLWSSLMLFNVKDEANNKLTYREVNEWDGRKLHNLAWLPDNKIGGLPESWNWIPSHSTSDPQAVHFTEGMPFMPGYEHCSHSNEWFRELAALHHPGMNI